jgi:hypothetical protein
MYVNEKIISVETILGMGEGNGGKGWKRWIQIQYIWYIVRTFANATMYPHPEQYKKGKNKTNSV